MNIIRKLTRTGPLLAALTASTIGLATASNTADAYVELNSKPTIGCFIGMLEVHGRGVLASFNGETIYSRIDLYQWGSNGWQKTGDTGWTRLNAGVTTIAANEYQGVVTREKYYAAIEHLARWDGSAWQFDSEVTQLMSSYAGFGDYYGSGYYTHCR